jgi:hypothetical protein
VAPTPSDKDITPGQLYAMAREQKLYEMTMLELAKKKKQEGGTASTEGGGAQSLAGVSTTAGPTGDESDGSADTVKEFGSAFDSTVSRSSKSRPSAHRGTGRKKNKREKTAEKFAAKFPDFKWSQHACDTPDPQATIEAQSSRMLYEVRPTLAQFEAPRQLDKDVKVAGSITEDPSMTSRDVVWLIKGLADIKKVSPWWAMRKAFGLDEDIVWTRVPDAQAIAQMNLRFIQSKDGYPYCQVCQCWSNDQHLAGRQHAKGLTTQFNLDFLVGPSRMPRPTSVGLQVPKGGLITAQLLEEFWGSRVALLHRAFAKKAAFFRVKASQNKPERRIPSTSVRGMSTAVISYQAGTGKYSDSHSHHLIFFHELPCKALAREGESYWPIVILNFDKQVEDEIAIPAPAAPPSIYFNKAPKDSDVTMRERSEDVEMEAALDMQESGSAPSGSAPPGAEPEEEPDVAIVSEVAFGPQAQPKTKVWVSCVRQGEEDEPPAWPLTLRLRGNARAGAGRPP